MPILILLLFIGIPIVEIALFIAVGGEIGLGWTLICIVATAVIGTMLVRHQGLQTLENARAAMSEHRLPVREVVAGVCILVAGALLLTPGFLTDMVGFALLVPFIRTILGGWAVRNLHMRGQFRTQDHAGARTGGHADNTVIDGEFEEIVPEEEMPGEHPDPASPWRKNNPNAVPGNQGSDDDFGPSR